MNRRPTLVVLDFRISRANRYVPKITAGFYREKARIGEEIGQPTGYGWGGKAGLKLIEEFRVGSRPGQIVAVDQLEIA